MENVSEWLTAVDGLPDIHSQFAEGCLSKTCQGLVTLIRREDGPDTLFCRDPPYLHDTRTSPNAYGNHEMNEADHRQLLLAS